MIISQEGHPDYEGVVWGKSSHSSDPDLAVCVNVAAIGEGRHALRDSTQPSGSVIELDRGALRGLLAAVKAQA